MVYANPWSLIFGTVVMITSARWTFLIVYLQIEQAGVTVLRVDMIRLTKACLYLFISVTYPSKIRSCGAEDSSASVAGARLILHRVYVDINVINISGAELPTTKSPGEGSV